MEEIEKWKGEAAHLKNLISDPQKEFKKLIKRLEFDEIYIPKPLKLIIPAEVQRAFNLD